MKRLLELQNGADYKLVESAEGYPVIGSGGPFTYASDFLYDGESVLLGRKGTIDKPLHVTGRFWTVDTMFWSKICSDVDGRFAYYSACTIPFAYYSTSTALPSMTQGALKGHSVCFPPLPEQSAIANFLDRETAKIDALVEEQRRLIDLLKEKRQTVISHAVTKGLDPSVPMKDSGVEWLGEVPAHWEVAPLSYRYEVQLGRMLNEARSSGDSMRPYLRVFDVQWGAINVLDLPQMNFPSDARSTYRLEPGDLLVNEGGSYVGRSAIWRGDLEECYFQKALHRVRPRDKSADTAEFLLYVMEYATNYGVFVAGGNQTTIDHLTAEQYRRYRFAYPPLTEQIEIATFINQETERLGELVSQAERAISLFQERRSALISAAVTGKIDVRGLVPASSQTEAA
ncbi:MAG: restriction endonuclease subunit S [Caulobacter sp.]|nr:restriction endonuclease subunit S [Caulobacter sp.]